MVLKKIFFFLLIIIFAFPFCKKDESPTAPQNHLPKIESLSANPPTVLISTETTLTCIATDEDGDNLTITWSSKRGKFLNGNLGISVKWLAPSTAGTDTINVTLNDGKQTVKGFLEISVGTISEIPDLLTPTNNEVEVSLTPTLTWKAISSAISYSLQVSTSNTFSPLVFNQSGITNVNQQLNGLNINTVYYWRVNVTNLFGTSNWSGIFSFQTVAPPPTPVLLLPVNNANDISISPTLRWKPSTGATSYELQVSTNNSFIGFAYNKNGLTNESQQIAGLSKSTKYFWRVSAINNYGTSNWSSVWSFIANYEPCPHISSISYLGQIYNTVQIGNQCWLKENLNVGIMIDNLNNTSNNNLIEKYCYNNDTTNCNLYGGLYQWDEAMAYNLMIGSKGICPDGWHIPTKTEFESLAEAINHNGNSLKAIGQGNGEGAGNNTSGFSALLVGYRKSNGSTDYLRDYTGFWRSTDRNDTYALTMVLGSMNSAFIWTGHTKDQGFSIRCIKD
jgi:uncharacterized protein (TIGR02145 family)